MGDELQIHLTSVVVAIVSEVTQPYRDFVERLYAEGRITDEEVQGLHRKCAAREGSLAQRVAERLAGDPDSSPPSPDQA